MCMVLADLKFFCMVEIVSRVRSNVEVNFSLFQSFVVVVPTRKTTNWISIRYTLEKTMREITEQCRKYKTGKVHECK